VAYLPASRLEEALIPGLTIAEHALLLGGGPALRLDRATAQSEAGRRIRDYRIKGLPETAVEELSGGNQQRLLLSQLRRGSRLLLLDNPTRGLDLESGRWVWQLLMEHARNGAAILFASPEIDEILATAGRVLVFFNGRIVMDVSSAEAEPGRLAQAIAGVAGGGPSC
jgi:simple sugar transport system ATP-binding protein